ncbi:MAG: RNA polymerase sigma factor SigZ [Planctomycetota bacterium]|nr:RNA polymerase sigma factor SigZ [Planctomycetaceae bacterium]MDQ3329142.1 RNA polymerase sigma factor SigZ [Planctomycetota bacterium]
MNDAKPTTDAVWSQLSGDLWRFIRRRVPDDHVADDLLQETFLRIHRKLDSLGGADRLAAWVYQIARNTVHDHHRRRKSDAALGEHEPADDSEDDLIALRSRAGGWLDELIAILPDGYRDAVRYAELEGRTAQEVADRLGLSLPAAKSRVRRGRLMLRDRLDACCRFETDRLGNVVDYTPRPERTVCRDCGDGRDSTCS